MQHLSTFLYLYMQSKCSTYTVLLAAKDDSGVVSHIDSKTVEVVLVTENHRSLHSRRWDLTEDLCTLRGVEKKSHNYMYM